MRDDPGCKQTEERPHLQHRSMVWLLHAPDRFQDENLHWRGPAKIQPRHRLLHRTFRQWPSHVFNSAMIQHAGRRVHQIEGEVLHQQDGH
jgi:hypothetical protein